MTAQGPEGSGEPQGGAPGNREGSGAPQGGAPVSPDQDRARRLLAAAGRIRASAPVLPDGALTDPDPESGERWDRGQVLAHVAEMLPYWAQQAELVAAGRQAEFGRVKSDPDRIAAIERDRREDPDRLLARLDEGVAVVLALLERLDDRALTATARHQTLGDMTVGEMVDRFLVAHLEEHADQLDPPEGSGEPQGGAPGNREGSGEPQGGAPVDEASA